MSIRALAARLAAKGIRLGSQRSELVIDAPDGVLTDELIQEIRSHKNELLAWLSGNGSSTDGTKPPLTRVNHEASAPLSFAQQRLWYLELLDPGRATYNMAFAYRIDGNLVPERLERSLNASVQRHEILRTCFAAMDGLPQQIIRRELHIDLERLPNPAAPPDEETLQQILLPLAMQPFDLQSGPLLRAALLQYGPEQWALLLVFHHLVFDGASLKVLEKEIAASCSMAPLPETAHPRLPELPVQYADFARWQSDWLDGPAVIRHLAYWLPQLEGRREPIALPVDYPYPPEPSYNGARVIETVGPELAGQLKQLATRHRATLFNVLMTAFFAHLWRVSRESDVTIGFPFANREPVETEDMIGLFVNTLPLRLQVTGEHTFSELLVEVRSRTIEAINHADLPFEKLVEELRPARDLARAPVFQVLLSYLDGVRREFSVGDLTVRRLRMPMPVARMDLSLFVTESDGGLEMVLEYNSDVFQHGTAERLLYTLVCLLQAAVQNPDAELHALTQLPRDIRDTILGVWNDTDTEFPGPARVDQLVLPRHGLGNGAANDAVVVFEGRETGSRQLSAVVERYAAILSSQGIGTDDPVGILLNRSPAMLAAMLAVLRAGGAYLPLDPSFPAARLAFMLHDSGARVLVTDSSLKTALPGFEGKVLCFGEENAAEHAGGRPAPRPAGSSRDLAYYLYTSGSTGQPKGVMVSHGNVCNFLSSMAERPGLGKKDTLVAVTTTSFDISVLELFLPLMTGARLVIASNEDASHGERLMRLLERHNATVMQATPATWRMLIDAGWRGAAGFRAFCGGETLDPGLARELLKRCSEVWNLYGPTETTVWSSCSRVTDPDAPVTVGRPVANTKIYVVDDKLALLPPGVPGEICIGGDGVARGYHGSDEFTAQRFIADPFCLNGRGRMYRTGDLGRWDSQGNLQHLGRLDSQVKIRGFRMELGEIERVLTQHASIGAAACKVWEPQKGDQRLVAYLVCRNGHPFAPTEIRKHLRAVLPDYMIPQILQPIDELPLTPNGKLDRNALPGPTDHNKVLAGKEAPATAEERAIADIWKEIIGISEVGRRDNFFELGGHSLLALRAAAAMEKRLGAPVELRHIILEDLAQLASRLQPAVSADPGPTGQRGLLARLLRS